MIYNEFADKKISGLGMGMMRLPVKDGNDAVIDEEAAAQMIDRAVKSGVNYFDTAWGYHGETSELVAGRLLSAYPRESYYLASKFPGYDNANMDKVKSIFARQLEKCRTAYFDFYMFHNVYEGNIDDYLDPRFGIMEHLLEQKQRGAIRHLGFSAHGGMDVLKRFLDAYGEHMEFCQLQVNYMDWHFQDAQEKVALMERYGLPVIVMEPLRGGRLAKTSDRMKDELAALRPEAGAVEWAFRFLQTLPGVLTVLSGMSDMAQLEENIDIWSTREPLSEQEFDKIAALSDAEVKEGELPCTACRYCISHCPQQLDIPALIALYNEHKVSGGGFIAPMALGALPEEKRPSACLACGSCEQVCPQQLGIAQVMKELVGIAQEL